MKSVFGAALLLVWQAFAEVHPGPNQTPQDWRAEKRLIDLHQHLDYTPERLRRAIKIMDQAGIGMGVNLSGGTVAAVW